MRHVLSAEAVEVAKDLDDGKYAYSWYENAQEGVGAEASSGAGLTSRF